MPSGVWTTKDGRKINITDMETSHIKASIKMLERNGFISSETFRFYLCCVPPDGDGANDAFNKELDEVLKRIPSSVMSELESELERREKQ